jgi:hypothetical protein
MNRGQQIMAAQVFAAQREIRDNRTWEVAIPMRGLGDARMHMHDGMNAELATIEAWRALYPSRLSGRGMGSVVMMEQGSPIVHVPVSGLGEVTLPDTMLTPGTVHAELNDVNDHVQSLMRDVATDASTIVADPRGSRFYNDWLRFHADWTSWYSRMTSSSGALQYLTGSLVSELRRRAAAYNEFEAHYRDITGHAPTFNPNAPSGQILPTEAWVGIGIGAGVLALGFVAWGLSSAAKLRGPIRGRRRR